MSDPTESRTTAAELAGREQFDRVADALSARVTAFEEVVASLPYRIAFEYKDGNEGLAINRRGNYWRLIYLNKTIVRKPGFLAIYSLFEADEIKWDETPLEQGSLRIKARAVMLFSSFLEEMAAEYERTKNELETAHREFERIDETLSKLEESTTEGA